ncbi:MAG: ABC-F family ATP-binding cassette domain-containing protein [Actinomycetota bacterium]
MSGLSVEVGGRLIVDGVSFTIMPKDKVGLVGRNGAGKTSLFKVLGGASEPTGGSIVRKGGFGYLPQDPRIQGVPDTRPAVTHVLSGRAIDEQLDRIEKLRIAMEEVPSERNVARYSRAQDEFTTNGGYAAESEARSIMAGLGLPTDRMDLPISVLSGGERRRVELSRILFAGSDLLLLDEPTNHLDVDAKTWLLEFMRKYRGALLVISHDLDLLDEAITRVIHLDRPFEDSLGSVVEYRGTYTQYRTARAKDEERLAKVAAQQGREIARLQAVVDRFGAKATKAAMAHSKEKQIARLESQRVEVGPCDRALRLRFPDPPPCGATVVTATSLSKAYGGPPVFRTISKNY